MEMVRINGVGFTYRRGKQPALRGIDLSVEEGELVIVMGASGSGKSTLLGCVNGLIPNFLRGTMDGSVQTGGVSTARSTVAAMASRAGLVFQDFETQLISTSVYQEVAFGPENLGVAPGEISRRIDDCLRRVGLSGFEEREPATLSGGQKQRLAIASVLAMNPVVLCMDEPTTDLDPVGKEAVMQIASDLRSERRTMIIAEHETEVALDADWIVVLKEGRIALEGSPTKVFSQVARLLEFGIQPPQITEFFAATDVGPLVTHLSEAEQVYRRRFSVHQEAYAARLRAEALSEEQLGEPVIELRDVTHRYPTGLAALKGVNLSIRQGDFVAVAGQNGSGKTTLVRHFNGLLVPTEGEVLINRRGVQSYSIQELARTVGYVFQNPDHQIVSETVAEEIAFTPGLLGWEPEQVQSSVVEALQAVSLQGYEREDPFSLAKGERQRVAVASVLAARPSVIILDEPTTGLDYREQRAMMDLVKRLNEAGHTIIIVTHTMWVIAEYARRVVVMKDGDIWLDGPTREVLGKEEGLKEASLRPPGIVALGNRLGVTVRSVEELLAISDQK